MAVNSSLDDEHRFDNQITDTKTGICRALSSDLISQLIINPIIKLQSQFKNYKTFQIRKMI